MRDGNYEKSVLDFFVVCSRVLPFVTRMIVDEDKKYILTNYQNVRTGGKVVDTDHATEIMDLAIEIETEKPERIELFDFKNKEAQTMFKKLTSETDEFTKCFENKKTLLEQVQMWQQVLLSYCKKSFKKIRIRKKNIKPLKAPLNTLIDKRNNLAQEPTSTLNKQILADITKRISDIEAEENRSKILVNFQQYTNVENFEKDVT